MRKLPSVTLPAVWMRGGTSKGLFFHGRDLPPPGAARDRLLLAALGSPDPYGKQIDGLGGATTSTSKAVIIAPSAHADCDVDYLFAHIAIREPVIDYAGNCGNLSAAVGVFAIEQGLVNVGSGPLCAVRVWQANLGQRMVIHVPVTPHGEIAPHGDYAMAGVPGTGARIAVKFLDPVLPSMSQVLPTGNVIDTLQLADRSRVQASLIAAANATVCIDPAALGLRGDELPAEVSAASALSEKVEAIRVAGALRMGLAGSPAEAAAHPATPKVALVSAPRTYRSTAGLMVLENDMDLCIRIFSMGQMHHALTVTGAVATAVAARLPGTLVQLACRALDADSIRLGHCAGTMEVSAEVDATCTPAKVTSATIYRTARTLMRGEIVLPANAQR